MSQQKDFRHNASKKENIWISKLCHFFGLPCIWTCTYKYRLRPAETGICFRLLPASVFRLVDAVDDGQCDVIDWKPVVSVSLLPLEDDWVRPELTALTSTDHDPLLLQYWPAFCPQKQTAHVENSFICEKYSHFNVPSVYFVVCWNSLPHDTDGFSAA